VIDIDSGALWALMLAPARAYREILYQPGGKLSLCLGERFDIVARPGQLLAEPPRAGDVLLGVTLGQPGGGWCGVFADAGLIRRLSRPGAQAGWYGSFGGARTRRRRFLDLSGRVPPGRLLLRERSTTSIGTSAQPPHDPPNDRGTAPGLFDEVVPDRREGERDSAVGLMQGLGPGEPHDDICRASAYPLFTETAAADDAVTVPPWAAGVGPFPPAPSLNLVADPADGQLQNAFSTKITAHNPTDLCVALVDLTGPTPRYAGMNDSEMVYVGSMMKVAALYAAFALKKQVQEFVTVANHQARLTAAAEIFPIIEAAWRDTLKALFPHRPEKPCERQPWCHTPPDPKKPCPKCKLDQNMVMPQLDKIFEITVDVDGAPKVTFRSACAAGCTAAKKADMEKQIDGYYRTFIDEHGNLECDAEFDAPGMFTEWMLSMTRWSSDLATSKVVDALGYFYINGLLSSGGFFNVPPGGTGGVGLWLSGDYEGHDWVNTKAEKDSDAGGQPLTARWSAKDAQNRVRSNMTATAVQAARLMTLMACGQLVDAESSSRMRDLLGKAVSKAGSCPGIDCCTGIGSYIKDALQPKDASDPHAPHDRTIQAKKGFGNDESTHECGIIEFTYKGRKLKYVAVVLGSLKRHGRSDFNAMVQRLDHTVIELYETP
jgi:hypothetical protein